MTNFPNKFNELYKRECFQVLIMLNHKILTLNAAYLFHFELTLQIFTHLHSYHQIHKL